MVLIYQLKEARKEHVFVFSVLFHNVSNHKVLSSYRKKIQLYDEANCCALRQRSATVM